MTTFELMRRPRILFIHQNYPAQFGGIAKYLHDRGWDVLCATARGEIEPGRTVEMSNGVKVRGYRRKREPSDDISRYLRPLESAVVNGQAFANAAIDLRKDGFVPDLICAHSGWGSGSFAKAVWPEARFISYLEWWYSYPPRDVDYDPKANHEDLRAAALCRNLPFFLDFQSSDAILTPTRFQAQEIPAAYAPITTILHDGVDCRYFAPDPATRPACLDGKVPDGAPIVTYATRGMEPKRGFPEFMAALEKVMLAYPDVHAVIAGADSVHYEGPRKTERSYKKEALDRYEYDETRLHFVGRLPLTEYRDLLQRTDVHVYLTQPFVLSWSLLEAMACGAPLVVSDCAPVREAIPYGTAARFAKHQHIPELVAAIGAMLDAPETGRGMGLKARELAVENFASEHIYPAKEAYFRMVIGRK
ncbi:MAG: glycosyltransferase [Pseudomonadota bacterium]